MKRKIEKVPEFDEIIFENRNRNYGAFDLRKRYKSAASLSILSGIAISTLLMTALSFTTNDYKPSTGPINVSLDLSKTAIPEIVRPPEIKAPQQLIKSIKNLQPKVVTDSSEITEPIPITDIINQTIKNGNVTDSVPFAEPIAPEIPVEEKIFIIVEEQPEFPGGYPALFKFIGENLVYPQEAEVNNIQGKVILKFVVNADGSADRVQILKGIDSLLDNEAIRVVKTLPKFKPGKQGGVPVPVWFTLPVVFKIVNN
jgi:periplasmic protein TonB